MNRGEILAALDTLLSSRGTDLPLALLGPDSPLNGHAIIYGEAVPVDDMLRVAEARGYARGFADCDAIHRLPTDEADR